VAVAQHVREAQAVTRQARPVGRVRLVEQREIARRGHPLGRQHFTVVALSGLDQGFLEREIGDEIDLDRLEQEFDIRRAVRAVEHQRLPSRWLIWLRRGTRA